MVKRRILQSLAGTVGVGMSFALAFAPHAMADTQSESETVPAATPTAYGYVELGSNLSNAQVTPFTVESAGGGTWNHGDDIIWDGRKHVWSYYMHEKLYHRATAIVGSNDVSTAKTAPGIWANADAYGWPWANGYAYWYTY
ncbi:lactococcin 972 family bacteriocin [Alicyclobacillus shizuokensis]|uniref:lactococcin 972 family bacteriocin n=1 Tax=Alicyclobacillus shizuokensis TaxID=392014 RepID=UPI000830C9FE|nr:lactococcin 972 family bacteriocin [Alicyclobacillus shizuokensis]